MTRDARIERAPARLRELAGDDPRRPILDSLTGDDIDESTLTDGLDGYERVTATLAESNVTGTSVSFGNAEISCPPGKKIISGGYNRSLGPADPVVDAIGDYPLDDDTWRVEFRLEPGQQINGTMMAVCAIP